MLALLGGHLFVAKTDIAVSKVAAATKIEAVSAKAKINNIQNNKAQHKAKPNILILFFDDMRFDSFSYRGGPVPTPNIDALAAASTRFDMAMTTTGLCSPSRAALFTGRWGHRTGLDDNVELWHSRLSELDPNQGGIIRRAKDAGYYIGYVGKWHLGANGPQKRGADFIGAFEKDDKEAVRPFTPDSDLEQVRGYIAGKRDANGEKHQYYETLPGTYEDTITSEKVRSGQEFLHLAAKKKEPFFGVISFQQPHPPYRVPEPYASMFDPDKVTLPVNHMAARVDTPLSQEYPYWPWHDVSHMNEDDWRKARAHYYGAIAMIDHAVGQIIETAKKEGVYDDLHIILLGDQGSMIGEHGLYDKAAYAYDELMRIPLLVRDPDIAPRIVNRHVSLMDIPATMSEWMGLAADGESDGRSLTPLMKRGDVALSDEEDRAFYAYEWYNGAWFGLRAIRTKQYKYVWNPGDKNDELYDLINDPGEMTNLAPNSAYKEQIRNLRGQLLDHLRAVHDPSAGRLEKLIARTGG
ncbi:sulfatase [Sphingorhabdus lutea]|uniref:Sulfatase n=2 Tax=Sphingorhabdus lutea TaxID=1913578 RepID=A0A1L3JEI2_9SPHN|nr:sulfatase [Sphingorhabdus lutea]